MMPAYCYTTEDGETVERQMGMQQRHPETITLPDGRVATRDFRAEHGGFRNTPGNWPLYSTAMAVHPSQRREAIADAARKGVKIDVAPDGRIKLDSPKNRRDYMKAYDFHDKDAGYRDRAPGD